MYKCFKNTEMITLNESIYLKVASFGYGIINYGVLVWENASVWTSTIYWGNEYRVVQMNPWVIIIKVYCIYGNE